MNIGIATFHKAANYGAVLQAFALQTFLRKSGYSPFFINHDYGKPPGGFRRFLGKTPQDTLKRWAAVRRRSVFFNFVKQYLIVSPGLYSGKGDLGIDRHIDACICGSDQVWNPNYLRTEKDERLFFLDFCPKDAKKISYAASLGTGTLSPEWTSRFVTHLSSFDFIGVREKRATDLLAKISGKNIQWVPDPTLLLTAEDYRQAFALEKSEQKYIFSYTLDKKISKNVTLSRKTVSSTLGYPMHETYERNFLKILMRGVYDPCQWLTMLANSRFVLTNSFHGTVFALLFQRPFIVLPIEGKATQSNIRMESLLERLGMEERFVKTFDEHKINQLCSKSIDWNSINKKIITFSNEGAFFLKQALSR
jgi:hypothetical protein